MYRTTLRIDGIACGACVMKITSCLEAIGAQNIHIDQLSGHTSFETQEKPDMGSIIEAVKKYDYRPYEVRITAE